jgi:hypothetical protein
MPNFKESVYFLQIFEIFMNLSSTGVKNASHVQRTAIEAVRFILRMDPERETSSEGTKRAWKRRNNFSRHISRKGPTTVGSARRCMRFSPLKHIGEISTCEVTKSRNHLDHPSRNMWRDLGISLTRKV